jgi:hypothetical protein
MKVDLYLNGQLVDGVAPDEVIALTRQAAKWNDITTRNADFSNVFSLMKTRQLMQFFGHPDEVGSLSEKPYRRASYELRVDDVPISSGFAQLEEVGEMVEVQLFSGIADFFDLLGDLSTEDIDISDQNHRWTIANIDSLRQQTALAGIVYPDINYRRLHVASPAVTSGDWYPAVYVNRYLNDAAASLGWTLQGFNDSLVLPFSQKEFTADEPGRAHVRRTDRLNLGGDALVTTAFNSVVSDPFGVFGTGAFPIGGGAYGYQCNVNGAFNFEATLNLFFDGAAGPVTITVEMLSRNPANTVVIDTFTVGGTGLLQKNYSGSFQFVSLTGNVATTFAPDVTIAIRSTGTVPGFQIYLEPDSFWKITKASGKVLANGWVDCNNLIKPTKLKDLFIYAATRENALLIADAVTRTLSLVPFNQILKTPLLDWSGYVDEIKKPEVTFTLGDGYGQTNLIQYKEPPENDPFVAGYAREGVGVLLTDNDTLPAEATIYQSPFAATYVNPVNNTTAGIAIGTFVPHILRFTNPASSYLLPDIEPVQRVGVVDLNSNPGRAIFISDNWENLTQSNYQALQQMLTRTKVVKLDVWLPMHEFINFDPMRPVFLLGQKWFVRKINQYKLNETESTEVELIRL